MSIGGDQFQRDLAVEVKRWAEVIEKAGSRRSKDMRPLQWPTQERTVAYCRQEANASLNAFSPGVPFSIARMARRLLL